MKKYIKKIKKNENKKNLEILMRYITKLEAELKSKEKEKEKI